MGNFCEKNSLSDCNVIVQYTYNFLIFYSLLKVTCLRNRHVLFTPEDRNNKFAFWLFQEINFYDRFLFCHLLKLLKFESIDSPFFNEIICIKFI